MIGPRTLAVARDAAPIPALEEFIAQRAVHYGTRRNFPTFGLGWMRRLAHVHTGALAMIG
jgi:lysozyme family protein